MKRILFSKKLNLFYFIISFIALTSCNAQHEEVVEYYGPGRIKAKYFKKNNQIDSSFVEFSDDGRLKLKGNFKKGKKDGIWISYNLNSESIDSSFLYFDTTGTLTKEHYFSAISSKPSILAVERIINYGEDTLVCEIVYYDNGNKNSEQQLLNTTIHGYDRAYTQDGKLFYESNFDHGFEQGTRKEWTKKTYKEIPFEKGFEHGLAKEWELGSKNLLSEKMYEHGKLLWEKSYKDGKVIREKVY